MMYYSIICSLTETLELMCWKLVYSHIFNSRWASAPWTAGHQLPPAHPLGEPSQVTVTDEWIGHQIPVVGVMMSMKRNIQLYYIFKGLLHWLPFLGSILTSYKGVKCKKPYSKFSLIVSFIKKNSKTKN